MFAIEYHCGRVFGGWVRGNDRYSSQQAAADAMIEQAKLERSEEITPFRRRVVPA